MESPSHMESPSRPPYFVAAVFSAIVLGVYLATLAPTTAFWDTSEYIAAAKVLGIPHPGGEAIERGASGVELGAPRELLAESPVDVGADEMQRVDAGVERLDELRPPREPCQTRVEIDGAEHRIAGEALGNAPGADERRGWRGRGRRGGPCFDVTLHHRGSGAFRSRE